MLLRLPNCLLVYSALEPLLRLWLPLSHYRFLRWLRFMLFVVCSIFPCFVLLSIKFHLNIPCQCTPKKPSDKTSTELFLQQQKVEQIRMEMEVPAKEEERGKSMNRKTKKKFCTQAEDESHQPESRESCSPDWTPRAMRERKCQTKVPQRSRLKIESARRRALTVSLDWFAHKYFVLFKDNRKQIRRAQIGESLIFCSLLELRKIFFRRWCFYDSSSLFARPAWIICGHGSEERKQRQQRMGKTSSVSSYSAVVKWTNYKFLWAGGLECDRSVGERKRSKCFDGRFMCWLVKIADSNRSRPEWWICCGCRYCRGESKWLKAVESSWARNLGKLSWKFLKKFQQSSRQSFVFYKSLELIKIWTSSL